VLASWLSVVVPTVTAMTSAAGDDGWAPLFEREDPGAAPVLFEGVPDHLDIPLRDWLRGMLLDGQHAERVGLRLRLRTGLDEYGLNRLSMLDTLTQKVDGTTLLRAVDAALYLHPAWAFTDAHPSSPEARLQELLVKSITSLHELLLDAGSAYRLAPNGQGLQQRVDATATAAADLARESARQAGRPEAARDLADAWAAVYGLHPNPSEAYRLAIRAVEDAAVPVVTPQNARATLGTVLAHLRDTPARWQLSITAPTGTGVDPLVGMLTLLWTGQSDRHAGQADLTRVDQGAAEMAVHLAATLVQWFAAGHVQRAS
jgi:hypothetical protein